MQHSGTIDDANDAEALEMGPNGEELRHVLVPGMNNLITLTTWCSRDGIFYDRHYDPVEDEFSFAANEKSCSLCDSGSAFQVRIGVGMQARTVRVIRAIATAWTHAPKTAKRLYAHDVDSRLVW